MRLFSHWLCFVSFSILNIADMTTDGAFVLGGAVSAVCCVSGHPILALPAAMLARASAGFITAFLQTKLGVPSILAGIVTNTGLYTVNLMAMGWKANQSLLKQDTIYTLFRATGIGGDWNPILLSGGDHVLAGVLLVAFLGTRLGLGIRATGDNPDMVRSSSINPTFTITVGLCVANATDRPLRQHGGPAQRPLPTSTAAPEWWCSPWPALVIGETLIGKGSMVRLALGVLFGSILYRLIYSAALRANVPADYMKLVRRSLVVARPSRPPPCGSGRLSRRESAAPWRDERGRGEMLELKNLSKTFHSGTVHEKKALCGLIRDAGTGGLCNHRRFQRGGEIHPLQRHCRGLLSG